MRISVELTGNKKLLKKLNKLEKALRYPILKAAFEDGAEVVKSDAESRIPIGTGELRDSLEIKSAKAANGIATTIGTDVYYGLWIEKGHAMVVHGKFVGIQPAAPFLTPAFDSRQREALSIIEARLEKEIMKVAG